MDTNSFVPKDTQTIPLEEIYSLYLANINDISFTRREIDIISCLLSGKTMKKIASFFSIAPKTVENHVRNIMLKIGCHSKSGIIDFIEKSEQYILIKKYYSSLLFQSTFEMELEKTTPSTSIASVLPLNKWNKIKNIWLQLSSTKKMALLGIICIILGFCFWCITMYFVKQSVGLASTNWNIPKQDHPFIGRQALLDKLHNKLQETTTSNPLTISACAGLGGIGKTQLALQYAHHSKYPYTFKAWFPAENIGQLHQKYLEFAKSLGCPEALLNIRDSVPYVNNWLSTHPGWLLIYDNVNSYDEIAHFLPEEGGHVILTTRNRSWPEKFHVLSLDVMEENEALLLLESSMNHEIEKNEISQARELVKLLGYLPLAVAQAGAYIHQTQIKIEKYLTLYKKHEPALLADKITAEGSNGFPVAMTWNISLAAIMEESKALNEPPLAVELLTACAYLAPEKISRQQLLTWFKKAHPELSLPELYLNKLIVKLWKYSLINYDGEDHITVHRLVQAILRHQDRTHVTREWYGTLLSSIHQEFDVKTEILTDRMHQRSLFPHAQSLISYYDTLWPNAQELDVGHILFDIGIVLSEQVKDPKSAQLYFERALKIFKKHYTVEHPKVASTLEKLGGVHDDLGNNNQSKTLFLQALTIKEKLYGKDHHEVSHILARLGRLYHHLGDKNGVKFLEQALKIQQKHYAKDDTIVAITLRMLGDAYLSIGNPKLAKEYEEQALKIFELHPETDQSDIGIALMHLARACNLLGEHKQATVFLRRVLKNEEQQYGKDHWYTAFTYANLAIAYHELGETKQEKELLEKSLKIDERHFGKDHWVTASTLTYLGRTYGDLGEYLQQKALLERALKIRESHFAADHFEISRTLTYLGKAYNDLEQPKQAQALLLRALKIRQSYYGENHYEVAETLTYLAEAYKKLGHLQSAKALLERALSIREQHYGRNHSKVARTLTALERVNLLLENSKS